MSISPRAGDETTPLFRLSVYSLRNLQNPTSLLLSMYVFVLYHPALSFEQLLYVLYR